MESRDWHQQRVLFFKKLVSEIVSCMAIIEQFKDIYTFPSEK